MKGRSYCPHCRHALSWKDLFPLFSFLFLGGKCRYCKEKISWQYPAVEALTGLIFLLTFNFQAALTVVYLLIIICFLIIIFIYDLKHYIIPDKVLFPAIIIVLIYRMLIFLESNHWKLIDNGSLKIDNFQSLSGPIFSAIGASAFFLAIFLVSRGKWMGFGDVKLAFFMGLFLGFPSILLALFLSFFFGAIMGVGLIFAKKKKLKSEIPFGPFLIAGTFVALFYGERIITWYLNLIL